MKFKKIKSSKTAIKKWVSLSFVVMALFVLSSCGTIVDTENKNITIDVGDKITPAVDIYYDASNNMLKYINDNNFNKVIYSAYSCVDDAWNGAKKSIFTVSDTINDAPNSLFTGGAQLQEVYSAVNSNIVGTLNEKINADNLSVIITDLGAQLSDYNSISRFIIDNGLSKDKAVAVIGVDSDADPYYILVIGERYSVSDYVSAFKNKPDIKSISEAGNEEFALDVEKPINYQILADKSGIMGINYEGINFVKGEGDMRKVTKTDRLGLDNIEGMVNFYPQTKIIESTNMEAVDIGAISLLSSSDIKSKYGGKIKMYIPFHIIDGVHLSTMDCTVTSELYIEDPANKGNLKKYENDYSEFIETDVAEGVTPEQGKWRVDDKTNSLIFNVTFPNAAKLPAGSHAIKLDVTMEHFSSTETLPVWVTKWDKGKTQNLVNMFSAIYNYQEKSNSAKNTFTLYVGLK